MLQGAASLFGLALSLVNLKLLEEIFSHALVPSLRRGRRALLGLALKVPLLFGGVWIALGPLHLSPIWFLAGFTFVLAVIVLKVLGHLLISSRLRLRDLHRRGTWLAVLALLVLAPAWILAQGHGSAETAPPAHSQVPAEHTAGDVAPAAGEAAHGEAAETETGHGGNAHAGPEEAASHGAAAEGHGAAEHGGEGAHEEHPPELPNLFGILHTLFPDQAWAGFLYRWENPIYATLVILLLCIVAGVAYRRRTLIPGPLQNLVELLVESFSNFILGILGPRGKEFVPFLGTLFFYIWLNNLQGLVPFLKSPTAVFNTTFSLGICVFCYVQFTGITKLGLWGYLHHMMGSPEGVIGWCMVPLMLPLHLIEEVAKPISLSLRLFGNILGEDVLLGVFATLGIALLAFTRLPVGIPLHVPFIFLSLLMSTIQALVFTLLATIYFSQMLPHEEEHGGHGH